MVGLSGLLHPYEFIPITGAATLVLLWRSRDFRSSLTDVAILCVPASAVVLFYFLPTLTHPWLKVATDLCRHHGIDFSHRFFLHLSWPLLIAFVFALLRSGDTTRKDCFLACYVVGSLLACQMPFLPWPGHLQDGLNYARSS